MLERGGRKKLPFGRKGNEETSQFSTDIINTMLATPFGDFCLCDRLHVQLVNCIIPAESGEQGTGKGRNRSWSPTPARGQARKPPKGRWGHPRSSLLLPHFPPLNTREMIFLTWPQAEHHSTETTCQRAGNLWTTEGMGDHTLRNNCSSACFKFPYRGPLTILLLPRPLLNLLIKLFFTDQHIREGRTLPTTAFPKRTSWSQQVIMMSTQLQKEKLRIKMCIFSKCIHASSC